MNMVPNYTTAEAAKIGREIYGLEVTASDLPGERDRNFRLVDAGGAAYVLKISNAGEALEVLDLQNQAIEFLGARQTGLLWPRVVPSRSGDRIARISTHFVRLLTWVPGVCLAQVQPHSGELLRSLGRALAATDLALAGFDHPAARRTMHWDLKQADMARAHLPLLTDGQRALVEPFFEDWEQVEWGALPHSVIHNDGNDYNVLVDEDRTRIVSLLDFGDMVHSATVCNPAVALAYVMLDRQDPIAAAAQVAAGYSDLRALSEAEVDVLYTLAATRLAMSVCHCAWQSGERPENEYLNISNAPAWALLEKLASFPAGWATEVFRRACRITRGRTAEELAESRRSHLGPSLSISYRQPLHIVRGWRQHLYDSGGRRYLDCVNNVAHVGHCHPRVVSAGAAQMARLNTNTRYLYDPMAEYVERLAAKLPARLSVVYLVCSGSEANELALRIARAHTGRDGFIVVETGYHGNTNALIDISPYKFNGPGGRGKPKHVEVVGYDGLPGRIVAEAAARLDGAAAFISEPALSCAGQVFLRPGYLDEAYAAVRAAGGVAIADEVQTGFGRAGSHFWMFETQGVIPDIVTMGKPIGNGHPMGAVATTPEIAASFANGMEYFNTFGGNPVSCAIGLAVLNVIRDEGLQENAQDAGGYLIAGLRDLMGRCPLISDVRGRGLFLGFEMRRDGLPAADEASELVNRMKDKGVLLSTDGPEHNVIKIKPPMVFGRKDADVVLEGVAKELGMGPRANTIKVS